MSIFQKNKKSFLIAVIFVLLVSLLILQILRFSDYKLRTNLTAFQIREMKSTVNNYIVMIDSLRKDMDANLKKGNVYCNEEEIKEATLTFIRHVVHESTFANGAYVWINEVTNYDGGENYGIRQVHGNLPETEGMQLSTFYEDAKGNFPYREELEGIKANGEITYRYFFKEYHNDAVSEKITYAKLYEPYNWIICTGTYLNSMYNPAGGVTFMNKLIFYISFIVIILIALILFTYIIISNILNSHKLIKQTEILKNEVEKDSLTGAGSRSFGNTLLFKYLNNFREFDKNYTIAILDIDNFKKINDCYGHNMGDIVMKSLVTTIKQYQKEEDHIIRWGGDEFILTFNGSERNIEELMETIRSKVAEQTLTTEDGKKIHYTISIGVSHFNEKDQSIIDTIKRIDDALYLAKRNKNTYYIMN
ncbi:MAG: diguanylate cyclase [Treponema sp.]|nr:diguanylate cyclase [Treponema sp.]